jgi:beta-glucosidase
VVRRPGHRAALPFGFGLSYTTFVIANPTVSLANTGARTGAEVVQVYLSMPASLGEPTRRLDGWQKVTLPPGANTQLTIRVDGNSSAHPLGYRDEAARAWAIAPGDHGVYVGNSSRSASLAGTVRL